MPFAITGAKYAAASVSAVGTSTVTVSTAPFVSGDFASPRLIGLWSSASVFKGMAWARRFVSTSQIELQTQFFDPATGAVVTQVVGDLVLVSKNFSESVTTGLAVSNKSVTLTDSVTFGSAGNEMGLCFYDEDKDIASTSTIGFSGGLTVLGRMEDYATTRVSSSCDFFTTVGGSPTIVNIVDTAAHAVWNGGTITGVSNLLYVGSSSLTPRTYIFNKVTNYRDFSTSSPSSWGTQAARCQLIECTSIASSTNTIMVRWRNGIIRGGNYRVANYSAGPISVYGDDNAGNYSIGANAGARIVVSDLGPKAALVRSNGTATLNFTFTNVITPDFRSVSGQANPLVPNPNGTNIFRFSDSYTTLQPGTVGVVLNNSSTVDDSVLSSISTWSPSLLRRTCVGATVTVNATSWEYSFKKYGYQPISGVIAPSTYDLGPVGMVDNVAFGGAVNQLADAGVTLTQSAAAALTQINTLDQFYDATINWGTVSTSNAQYPSLGAYPVSFAGTVLDLGSRNLIVDGTAAQAFAINTSTHTITVKSLALAAGAKFKSLTTTGTVTFANGGTITATYTDSTGTLVTIRTADNLPLSTEILVNGTPQGWVTGNTSRTLKVQPSTEVDIYAHAYGRQPLIVHITGNTASDYVLSLLPETNVDTTLSSTTRDTIAAGFAVGVDAQTRLFLSVSFDMRPYAPADVLNALHYFTVTQGSLIALAALSANSVGGFALIRGGFVIRSPGFYGKVNDAVTEDTDMGIYVPLYVMVDPGVYTIDPTYTPVKKNSSGVVLGVALWTQKEADVPSWVANQSSLIIINDGVKKASIFKPHTANLP